MCWRSILNYCHVCSTTKPSMKAGTYQVYVLLGRTGELATMAAATCECAAGHATSLLSTQFYMNILNPFHHAASHFIYMYIPQEMC